MDLAGISYDSIKGNWISAIFAQKTKEEGRGCHNRVKWWNISTQKLHGDLHLKYPPFGTGHQTALTLSGSCIALQSDYDLNIFDIETAQHLYNVDNNRHLQVKHFLFADDKTLVVFSEPRDCHDRSFDDPIKHMKFMEFFNFNTPSSDEFKYSPLEYYDIGSLIREVRPTTMNLFK